MLGAQEKARYTWRCRRGMLELDLILQDFLKSGLETLSDEALSSFDLLLDATDPQLFAWLMGHEIPENQQFYDLIERIRTNN